MTHGDQRVNGLVHLFLCMVGFDKFDEGENSELLKRGIYILLLFREHEF